MRDKRGELVAITDDELRALERFQSSLHRECMELAGIVGGTMIIGALQGVVFAIQSAMHAHGTAAVIMPHAPDPGDRN